MPVPGLSRVLAARLDEMARSGRLKGQEAAITGVAIGDRVLVTGDKRDRYAVQSSNGFSAR